MDIIHWTKERISLRPGMYFYSFCIYYLLFYVINIFYLLAKVMLVMRLDMKGILCDNKILFDKSSKPRLPSLHWLLNIQSSPPLLLTAGRFPAAQ